MQTGCCDFKKIMCVVKKMWTEQLERDTLRVDFAFLLHQPRTGNFD
jgi:hypothetical protein